MKDNVIDVIKCLEHVELHTLRLTCAPLNELPSNISTMNYIHTIQNSPTGIFPKPAFCIDHFFKLYIPGEQTLPFRSFYILIQFLPAGPRPRLQDQPYSWKL